MEQLIVALILGMLMGFFLIWQHVTSVRCGYEVQNLKEEFSDIQKECTELASRINSLTSPAVLLGKAGEMGFQVDGRTRWAFTPLPETSAVAANQQTSGNGERNF